MAEHTDRQVGDPGPPGRTRKATGGRSSGAGPTGLRRDAQRNRELLLTAAREVFAEQGLAAPLDLIARRAGVGNATLYRRFPTRDALIEEVFGEALAGLAEAADEVLAIEDAWTALTRYFERIFALVAADRGINDLVTMSNPDIKALADTIERNTQTVAELVTRAQEQGTLRTDVTPIDLLVVMGPICRAVPVFVSVHPEAWRRYLVLVLEAFRSGPPQPLPGLPTEQEQLDQVFSGVWEIER
ncbi:helix-turn-helix domain-containing protein [Kitasatospora sp. GP82]|uniref:TetR/AcrR family transcriptional regulator n=1 Tax=Kitasatospora sp. GP82 TaxID=3035089 RepID=UPI0024740E6F|nr:helix-turn-helix domain-containing protein [Kitasatospora sp. GP82]MDH6130575.1 AcrR family transcriptional regulator [Kitasatospora sp. GP82]